MVLQAIIFIIKDESSSYHQDAVDYLKNDGLWILSYLLNLYQFTYGFSITILNHTLKLIEALDNIQILKGISIGILIFNKENMKFLNISERLILIKAINQWFSQHPSSLDLARKNGAFTLMISYILKLSEKQETDDPEHFAPLFETIKLLINTEEAISEEESRWLKFLLLECKIFLLEETINLYVNLIDTSILFCSNLLKINLSN